MRYNVRCRNSKCQARGVLAKHPLDYKRPMACWSCGRREWRIDWHRMREDHRAKGCNCAGYGWSAFGGLHRRGSRLCWYRADGTQRMPGDADFCDPNWDAYREQDAAAAYP